MSTKQIIKSFYSKVRLTKKDKKLYFKRLLVIEAKNM